MDSDKRIYIRDKRSPIPSSEVTSRVMSSIKAKNTKPEMILRKLLWKSGLRGYRLHWKGVEGRPDIAYPGKKIAIFINGCYWHRCPKCDLPIPKTNADFWKTKFSRNVARDAYKKKVLEDQEWKILTFWECDIKENPTTLVPQVKIAIKIVDKK